MGILKNKLLCYSGVILDLLLFKESGGFKVRPIWTSSLVVFLTRNDVGE